MLVHFAVAPGVRSRYRFQTHVGEIVIHSLMWFSAPRDNAVLSSYFCNPIS